MTNNVALTFSVGDNIPRLTINLALVTLYRGLRLVFSKTTRIGDTKIIFSVVNHMMLTQMTLRTMAMAYAW